MYYIYYVCSHIYNNHIFIVILLVEIIIIINIHVCCTQFFDFGIKPFILTVLSKWIQSFFIYIYLHKSIHEQKKNVYKKTEMVFLICV